MNNKPLHEAAQGWRRFWFTPRDPAPLALVRIITGVVLLYTQLVTWPGLMDAIGPTAWLDRKAVAEARQLGEGSSRRDYSDPQARIVPSSGPLRDAAGQLQRDVTGNLINPVNRWAGTFSIWFYLPETPAFIQGVQAVFLLAMLCLVLGLGTRIATILAWVGHVSYLQRGMVIYSGMDAVLLTLLVYLCFAPAGAVASLDAWLRSKRRAGGNMQAEPSVSAGIVLRLIQVHLCFIYFCAGTAKLQGPTWWNGTAGYLTMMSPEYGAWDMGWLARHEILWQIVSITGGFFTLAVEIGLPFLIWHRALRPLVLVAALWLHLAVAMTTGLSAFQAAMVAGLAAFVPAGVVRKWLRPVSGSDY